MFNKEGGALPAPREGDLCARGSSDHMLQGQPQDHLLERMIPPGGSAGQQERQMVLGSHPRGKSSVTRDW